MNAPSLYTRYQAGEFEPVWEELVALGAEAYTKRYYPTVLSVVDAFIDRVILNLTRVRATLTDLGYVFWFPEQVLELSDGKSTYCIEELESTFGQLPIVIRRWYERIVSVNFAQSYHDCRSLNVKPDDGFQGILGLGAGNGLCFQTIESRLEMLWDEKEAISNNALDNAGHVDESDWDEEGEPWKPFMGFGGFASSCEQKGFTLPFDGFDGVYYDNGYGARSFGQEIRDVFRWGGFPGWSPLVKNNEFYRPFYYRPDFPRLLPKLRTGLVLL